jgi:hypothetical protein
VPRRFRALGLTLASCGFKVIIDADRWCLPAVNLAAASDDPSDPFAVVHGPAKLVKSVHLADTGDLCWYWQWSGPTREGLGEYERLCPAAAIADATERISRVLALRDELAGVDE